MVTKDPHMAHRGTNMTVPHNMNWDDVRVFLTAMRASSLRQAADQLGVSHPTARRRLNALEARLGLRLFDRRTDGLHATVQAVELLSAAEEVEHAMLALSRVAQAADPELQGPVHVSLPDMVATDLLMEDLVAFSRRWPKIELNVQTSFAVADLSRREADVAVRLMPHGKSPDLDLAGRLAGTVHTATYGTPDRWIGWRGGQYDAEWIKHSAFPELPATAVLHDAMLQRSACAAGLGLTTLPCFFAEPLLQRRTDPKPFFDLWVLVHPDLRKNPRLRVFRDAVVQSVQRQRARLEGRAEAAYRNEVLEG
jgi:DNA-binding transcriptional LysR family regulator